VSFNACFGYGYGIESEPKPDPRFCFFFNLSIGYLSGVRRFLSILYVFRVVVSIRVWSKEV
jgi:hypothetical protein